MTDEPTEDRSAIASDGPPMTWMRRAVDRVRIWTPAQGPSRLAAPLPPEGFPSPLAALQPPTPEPEMVQPHTEEPETTTETVHELAAEPGPATELDLTAPTVSEDIRTQTALEMRIQELENELNDVRSSYAESVQSLRRASFELSLRVDGDILRLARRLAEAIVRRKVEVQPELVLEGLKAAFRLAGPIEKVTVKCSPEDVDFLRKHSQNVAHDHLGRWVEVAVQPTTDIDRGGVLLLYDGGVVDARIPSQLDRLTALVERAIGSQNYEGDEPQKLVAESADLGSEERIALPDEPTEDI